jgi:two-component system chemotaxis sensor kinase CheA
MQQVETDNKTSGNGVDGHGELLLDCDNLAAECLAILDRLRPFAFPHEGVFILEDYGRFLQDKKVFELKEGLESLANKIHGFKGISGFLIAEAKALCHKAEEVIKPLAELKLVFDDPLGQLLRSFVLALQDLLEQFRERGTVSCDREHWFAAFDDAVERSVALVRNNEPLLKHLIEDRCRDDGEIREPRRAQTILVSRQGYDDLLSSANSLFNLISSSGNGVLANRAAAILHDFLEIHQGNKLRPLEFSRYERLVPKLARQYGLRAEFVIAGAGILADVAFSSALHEICNQISKNAITHGIEAPDERRALGKDEIGRITFSASEDTLNYYVSISDDGRGIDKEKLVQKALAARIIAADRLAHMSEQNILHLVFHQGLSTVANVDDNAGRGLGMSAVSAAMTRLHGTCRIRSVPNEGTSWDFTFQKANVSLSCFIVALHEQYFAIPETFVRKFDTFHGKNAGLISVGGRLLPVLDTGRLFGLQDRSVRGDSGLVVVLATKGGDSVMVVERIIEKAVLFVMPLPALANESSVFAGIALHKAKPTLVIDAEKARAACKPADAGSGNEHRPRIAPGAPRRPHGPQRVPA